MNKIILPPHQTIARDVELEYANVVELFQAKTKLYPTNVFLVSPGKKTIYFLMRIFREIF